MLGFTCLSAAIVKEFGNLAASKLNITPFSSGFGLFSALVRSGVFRLSLFFLLLSYFVEKLVFSCPEGYGGKDYGFQL